MFQLIRKRHPSCKQIISTSYQRNHKDQLLSKTRQIVELFYCLCMTEYGIFVTDDMVADGFVNLARGYGNAAFRAACEIFLFVATTSMNQFNRSPLPFS
uniref:Uncharacterized protein n=1 Tax=Strigamia maritima TaxID=126957 RepID=T1IPC6_STRMM